MLLPRRTRLLLAATLAASSATLVLAAYSSSGAKNESHATRPTLKSKILRRQNRLKEKPNAYEKALLRKHAAVREERELEDRIPKHLPIKVKIRAEKEKAFKDLDNPNWLAELEIEVKNTGNKPIYYLLMALHLPEMLVGDSHEAFPLRYGRPALSEFSAKVEPDDVAIKSNETYVLRIQPKLAAAYQRRRSTDGSPQIKKLELSFQLINFGDGTGFQGTTAAPWPRKKAALGGCGPAPNPSLTVATQGSPTKPTLGMSKWRIGGELANSLPARFSYSSNLLFLSPVESTVEPDGCCPSGCSWLQGYEDPDTCYGLYCESIPRHRALQCSDSRGSCNTVRIFYQPCHVEEGDYWHNCPWSQLTSCGGPTPTPNPSPTPTPEPSPTPTPTPTPCPEGSFDPDQNGDCPTYASKINGCCVCQERNTDCARFGQGFLGGSPYCIWVEQLCDCYNVDGKCSENPRPSPTPTPTPGGGGGGYPIYYYNCTQYYWVWYVSYDGGETWQETGQVDYAGCW